MTDIYDQILDGQTSPKVIAAKPDIYDSILDNQSEQEQQRIRTQLSLASKFNPDMSAQAIKLARNTGLPVETVERNIEDVKRQAQIQAMDMKSLIANSPILARQLSDPNFAKLAHDDIENTSGIEKALTFLGKDVPKSLAAGALSAVGGTLQGTADLGAMLVNKDLRMLGFKNTQISENVVNPFQEAIDWLHNSRSQYAQEEMAKSQITGDTLHPSTWSLGKSPSVSGIALQGLDAIGQFAPQLALALGTAGLSVPEQLMMGGAMGFAQAYGGGAEQEYNSYSKMDFKELEKSSKLYNAFINKGMPPADAREAVAQAAAVGGGLGNAIPSAGESAFENWMLAALTKGKVMLPSFGLATKSPAAATASRAASGLIGGGLMGGAEEDIEQRAQTLGSNLRVGGSKELGADTFQQFVLGAIGQGVPGGIIGLVQKEQEAGKANQTADSLQKLNELAAANKVLQRDPETFQNFIAEASKDGPVQHVYVDANALMQSGVADKLAQVSPAIAEQLPVAASTGGQIAIPIAEYATNIAPTEYAQSLTDHLKTEPDGFSRAEAAEYIQTQTQELQKEIETAIASSEDKRLFVESQAKVHDAILEQLNQINRFNPQVNELNAMLIASRMATRASQLGITPEQMFEKQKLTVAEGVPPPAGLPFPPPGGLAGVGGTYNQSANSISAISKQWSDSGIKNDISENKGIITLSRLVVPESARGAGKGTDAMQQLINYADATGQRIALSPSADFGGNKKRLIQFYKRFGFVENKGKSRDFSISETMVREPVSYKQSAFHGSPYHFDKFTLDHIGKGEGAQAYGWGLYFAGNKEVAEYYRGALTPSGYTSQGRQLSGNEAWAAQFLHEMDESGKEHRVSLDKAIASIKNTIKTTETQAEIIEYAKKLDKDGSAPNTGQLYEVNIPDDGEYLLWDKPLSEQPENVHAAINRAAMSIAKALKKELNVYQDNPHNKMTGGETIWDGLSGNDLYKALDKKLGGQEAASKYLNSLGIQGIKYLDGSSRNKGKGSYNYVIFDDKSIEILNKYYQGSRGYYSPSTNIITLLKDSDLSTFLHESGHFFFENDIRLANELSTKETLLSGEQRILDDVSALFKWHGIEGSIKEQVAAWNALTFEQQRVHHERFAEAFESYLLEGKSPSQELSSAFRTFKTWLLGVYQSLKKYLAMHPEAGKLNDEVRQVFDRMLATEEQIIAAEESRSMMPLFVSAEDAGMSQEEYDKYRDAADDATQKAIELLQAKGIRDMQWMQNARSKKIKELQKQNDQKRSEIRAEVRDAITKEPLYQAWQYLTGKQTEEAQAGKLAIDGLIETYGDGAEVRTLKDRRMTAKQGTTSDEVAAQFGFASGDELVHALVKAVPMKDEIEARVDARMLETYGDITSPKAMASEANKAIYNDLRAKVMATEANVMAQATGQRKILLESAKEAAANVIAAQKIRNIKPTQYSNSASKAAKAAEKAKKSSDIARAANEKRNEVFNTVAAKAAYDALEEVDKGINHLKRITSTAALNNMRGEAKAQMLAILDRFDIRKSLSLKEIDRNQNITEWVQSEAERLAAPVPELSPEVANETVRTHYKNLSMEQFRGLMSSVKQLEHMARREQKAYITLRNMSIKEEVAKGVDEIRQAYPEHFDAEGNAKLDTPLTHQYAPTILKNVKRELQHLNAEFIPMEDLVDQLTSGKFGQLHDSLFGRLSDASDNKAIMAGAIRDRIKPAYDAYSIMEKRDFARRVIPGTNMTRENIVMLALYYGNEEGRQRLASQGFGDQQMAQRLSHLTEKDLNLIEAIWSLNDEYIWPMYKALNERTQGIAPPKVNPAKFTVNGRTMKGGYVKLVYDSQFDEATRHRDSMDDAKAMISGRANPTAKTEQGSSKERISELSKMPLLELRAINQAVNEHLHDIAYREAVADTVRLLRERDMRNAIMAVVGKDVYTELLAKVNEVAARPIDPSSKVLKALNIARKNTIVVLMSGVKTALVNYSGLIPALTRVNAGSLVKSIAKVHSWRMMEMVNFAKEKSTYMRERNEQFTSDMQHEMASLTMQNSIMPEMGSFLILMRMVDQITSTTVWSAAYEDGLKRFKDDARAVEYANNVVRSTQGSGRDVDTSKIMTRFGPWSKPFIMFYSFFNRQLSLLVRQGVISEREWNNGNKAKAVGTFTAAYIAIVVIPAMINDIAGGKCDKANDAGGWTKCISKAITMNMAGFVPVLRDVAPYAWGLLDKSEPDFGLRMTALSAYFEGFFKGVKSTVDMAEGHGDDKDTKAIFMGLAFSFGLPGKLMWDTAAGTEAVINKDAPPQAILFGPPKK